MIIILVTVNLLQMAELQQLMHHANINSLSAVGNDINPYPVIVINSNSFIFVLLLLILLSLPLYTLVALLQVARLQQLMHHAKIHSLSAIDTATHLHICH